MSLAVGTRSSEETLVTLDEDGRADGPVWAALTCSADGRSTIDGEYLSDIRK